MGRVNLAALATSGLFLVVESSATVAWAITPTGQDKAVRSIVNALVGRSLTTSTTSRVWLSGSARKIGVTSNERLEGHLRRHVPTFQGLHQATRMSGVETREAALHDGTPVRQRFVRIVAKAGERLGRKAIHNTAVEADLPVGTMVKVAGQRLTVTSRAKVIPQGKVRLQTIDSSSRRAVAGASYKGLSQYAGRDLTVSSVELPIQ